MSKNNTIANAMKANVFVPVTKMEKKPAKSLIKVIEAAYLSGEERKNLLAYIHKHVFECEHDAFAAANALYNNGGLTMRTNSFDGRPKNKIAMWKNPQVSFYITKKHITMVSNINHSTADQIRMSEIDDFKDFAEMVSSFLDRNGLTVMSHRMFYIFSNERHEGKHCGCTNLKAFYDLFVKSYIH